MEQPILPSRTDYRAYLLSRLRKSPEECYAYATAAMNEGFIVFLTACKDIADAYSEKK